MPKAQFLSMDVRQLSFSTNTFDGIWAQAVLLHIEREELPRVLKQFYRIMKPDGFLFIGLKRGKGIHQATEDKEKDKQRLYTYYYKGEVVTQLKRTGFQILSATIVSDALKRPGLTWVHIIARK